VQRPEERGADVLLIRDGPRFIAFARVDSDGMFMLTGVPAGRYVLRVRGFYCDRIDLPVSVRAGAVDSVDVDLRCSPIPCQKLDKADPGCILKDPDQRAKVGSPCEVHPYSRLQLDVVPISYGFVSHPAGYDSRFPNARVVYSAGCVIGRERWAEVAYCWNCRAAFYLVNPQYVLHPIQPLDLDGLRKQLHRTRDAKSRK